MFTAIVLSAMPVSLQLPGITVLPRVQVLRDPAALHSARLDALAHVTTPYCFFLDDDDALPDDYLSVLGECVARMQEHGVPMAYTDELLIEEGKQPVRRTCYSYDNEFHVNAPMAVHHLVLMDTARAQAVAGTLARGNYWTEHMLYWALGREGAEYVKRIGYHWHRNPRGFSRMPAILTAQVMAQRWIHQQKAGLV